MNLIEISLGLHVAAGMAALVVAPGAMLSRKGALWHRRWGKVYFWCMALVGLTAVLLSAVKDSTFLALVGVFSFYLALTGYRALYCRKPGQQAMALDWSAAVLALVGSLGLLLIGGLQFAAGDGFGIVALVFGGIGGVLSAEDLWRFRRPSSDPKAWFFNHMIRMLAAYIATVSAFSVVNLQMLPDIWRWLWPSVVGTVGIVVWVSYYKRRFRARELSTSRNSSERSLKVGA